MKKDGRSRRPRSSSIKKTKKKESTRDEEEFGFKGEGKKKDFTIREEKEKTT
jgi:hypothetical protein